MEFQGRIQLPTPLISLHFSLIFFFFFLNANWLLSYEQSLKTNSHHGDDDDGDDEYVTPENELLNLWNIFQHFLYKYKSTVKLRWDEHDNK